MRLGGRLQAAIEVLDDIEARRRPAADALKDWGLSHRFAGAGDRAAIGNIVYDVLRRKLSLGWHMDDDTTISAAYGALLSNGALSLADLDGLLKDDRFAPQALNVKARQAWEARSLHDAPDVVRADCPQWCVPSFKALFGDGWVAQAAALSERPPLDLRVNSLRSTIEKVLKDLAHAKAQTIDWFEGALRIAPIEGLGRHPNVQAEPSFQKGWFEVQDLGSQIVAHLSGAKAGQQVLDYCAGAGGKTMALSAAMENRGQIYAYDAEKARLAPIFDRLRRAGVRNAQPYANIAELAPLQDQMDLVLVDAPCTGSGTWRRRPDAKWRLSQGQLDKRVQEQREVLDKSAVYVRSGGRLVYITCSLFSAENDTQISSFLTRHSHFKSLDMAALWTEMMPQEAPRPFFPEYGLVLSPFSTSTDGFFIAVLERQA